MHPFEDIGISPWPVDVVEFGADAMPTGSWWMSNNYITRCHRRFESVGVRVAVPIGDKMPECEPSPDRRLGPSGPTVEQPSQNAKEVLLWSEELWVNMWQSIPVSNSPLTHNQHQPFRIKCERYLFIKKRIRSFIEPLHYVWLCFRLYLYMYCVVVYQYTTLFLFDNNHL